MAKSETRGSAGPAPCRCFFEITPDPIVVVGPEGLVRHGNPSWNRHAGPFAARPFAGFFHPGDRRAVRTAIGDLASGSPSASFRARLKATGAPAQEFSWSLTSCPEDGSILGIGRQSAPRETRDDRFRLAVEAAPNAMMVVAPGGRIVLVNAETEKIFGYSREELLNLSVDALVPARFRRKHASSCAEYFGGPRPRTMGSGRDLLGLRKDGREVQIEIGLNPMSTREGTFAMVSLIDITERKRIEERLRRESVLDPLTGLYNRRYLEATLEREIHRCGRRKSPLSIVFLDVDRFKRFNDTFGHAAGDEVLREVGRLLKARTRHGDVACRYGGEEFVVVLPETGPGPALRKAEELCRKMRETRLAKEGRTLGRITLSAGVAAFPDHGSTSEEVLKAADRALYRAKRRGRNRAAPAG